MYSSLIGKVLSIAFSTNASKLVYMTINHSEISYKKNVSSHPNWCKPKETPPIVIWNAEPHFWHME